MPRADLSRVRIVLVEPHYGGNIGQCARAMLNMGLSRLSLVSPRQHLTSEAYWMAREAKGILEGAEIFDSLPAALASNNLAIGTTRRVGKYRRPILTCREAAQKLIPLLGKNEAALVFGREDSGLTGHELDRCQWLVSIPANESFPSLNLAQAVLVCCYELFLATGQTDVDTTAPNLAGPELLERFYKHQEKVLQEIRFLHGDQAPSILRTLRRIYGRAALEPRDLKILHGVLAQMDWYRRRAEGQPEARIGRAREEDWPSVLSLLEESALPTAGLAGHRDRLFVARAGDLIVGCVAVEVYRRGAILRSLAVRADHRRTGLGRRLVAEALSEARHSGTPTVFLLTEDGEEFFARCGFQASSRDAIPEPLRVSAELRGDVCPASATVMRLDLTGGGSGAETVHDKEV
jgi:tRNA/rRNA methyltransferase